MLLVIGGTWPSVISLFHGLPFILYGLAVLLSRRYPGWLGVLGGAGSLAVGLMMFLGTEVVSESLYIAFALVVSLWMVILGVVMWRRAGEKPAPPSA